MKIIPSPQPTDYILIHERDRPIAESSLFPCYRQDNRQDKRCDIGLKEVYFLAGKSEIDFINGMVAD